MGVVLVPFYSLIWLLAVVLWLVFVWVVVMFGLFYSSVSLRYVCSSGVCCYRSL